MHSTSAYFIHISNLTSNPTIITVCWLSGGNYSYSSSEHMYTTSESVKDSVQAEEYGVRKGCMEMYIHWSVQKLRELLRPYRSDCVQPHWDLTIIRMKRWAAFGWPSLIVPILLGFEMCSLLVTLTWTLLPQGVHWICYAYGDKTIRVFVDRGRSWYAQVAEDQGVQIVWPYKCCTFRYIHWWKSSSSAF